MGSTTAGGHGAGEPSIGVDWSSGKAFIEAGNHTLRVTFNDTVNPATATWEDKRSPFARVSLDPILFTDDGHFGGRNRTFSSQLNLARDPSVAAGMNNTIYFGYVNGDGHAKVAVSRDRGLHWSASIDAGTPFGIQNAEFAEVIAGDDDRAAFAFLGTQTAGDTQSATFPGVWHLYVSFTYDAGRTWITTDATPADPVQRGCIWNQGGSNPCRNLLDFNDITVDKSGRVLVGYADGCTGTCVTDATQNATTGPVTAQDALATIARQVGGRGLFAALDGTAFGARRQ